MPDTPQHAESVPDTAHLQNKIKRQKIALQTLEQARGGVSVVKDQWVGKNEGYEAHTIEWGGHQWVRKDFYDVQVTQRNSMAERLSKAYLDLQNLGKKLRQSDGVAPHDCGYIHAPGECHLPAHNDGQADA